MQWSSYNVRSTVYKFPMGVVSLQKYFQSFSFHFYCTYLACATWYCDILMNWLLSAKKLTKQSFLFVTLLWLPMIRPYLQLIAHSQHEIAHHYYILNAVSYTWRLTHLPFLQVCSFDPHFPHSLSPPDPHIELRECVYVHLCALWLLFAF